MIIEMLNEEGEAAHQKVDVVVDETQTDLESGIKRKNSCYVDQR